MAKKKVKTKKKVVKSKPVKTKKKAKKKTLKEHSLSFVPKKNDTETVHMQDTGKTKEEIREQVRAAEINLQNLAREVPSLVVRPMYKVVMYQLALALSDNDDDVQDPNEPGFIEGRAKVSGFQSMPGTEVETKGNGELDAFPEDHTDSTVAAADDVDEDISEDEDINENWQDDDVDDEAKL